MEIGRVIDSYDVGEDRWPEVWRMPEEAVNQQEDVGGKISAMADDAALRAAINVLDNCLSVGVGAAPGTELETDVAAGLMGAYLRFVMPMIDQRKTDEEIGDWVRDVAMKIISQIRSVHQRGWFQRELDS